MLRTVMAKIAAAFAPKENPRVMEQTGTVNLARRRPARRAIGSDMARLARAPERPGDGGRAAQESARRGEHPRLVEHLRRIGFIVIPPWEERPRPIDRRVEENQPGRSEEHTSELQSLMRISYAVFC